MKSTKNILFTVFFLLIHFFAYSQENTGQNIKLNTFSNEQIANYAIWRTDVYICTGISYAKSLGKSVDDFATFVTNSHAKSIISMKGKGLEPPVQLLNMVITNYKNGNLEILSESDSLVTMRSNRPYVDYFRSGELFGVTVDEFEYFLYSHIDKMFDTLDLIFEYQIEDETIKYTLSIKD